MRTYTLEFNGTGEVAELNCDHGDEQAEQMARVILAGRGYPDITFADQWDADGTDDDDQPCFRLLIWADGDAAENDSGLYSVAQLCRVGHNWPC